MAPDKDVLGQIAARTAERVARYKRERGESALKAEPLYVRPPRSLAKALAGPAPRVIAEVKFTSPSSGSLRQPGPAEAARLAADYAAEGASFPGTGIVELGRGEDYAWSATSAGSDLIDMRVEKVCNPTGGAPAAQGR